MSIFTQSRTIGIFINILPFVRIDKKIIDNCPYYKNMSFWKNVDDELKFQCMERKQLAAIANFDVSYIGKGIKRNSIPSADLALRISKALNVSLEFLLDMPKTEKSDYQNNTGETNTAIRMYHKYSEFASVLDSLSPIEQNTILNLMHIIQSAHQSK